MKKYLLATLAVLVLGGCVSAQVAPYKDACKQIGFAGPGISALVVTRTPEDVMLLDAFNGLVTECRTLGDK